MESGDKKPSADDISDLPLEPLDISWLSKAEEWISKLDGFEEQYNILKMII